MRGVARGLRSWPGLKMAGLYRPLYKVSFHLEGSRGAGLLTVEPPGPPGYAPVDRNKVRIMVNRSRDKDYRLGIEVGLRLVLRLTWTLFLGYRTFRPWGGTHILRHTGTFRPFGSIFCKKSLDMGTTFHWKIPRHGSTFWLKPLDMSGQSDSSVCL